VVLLTRCGLFITDGSEVGFYNKHLASQRSVSKMSNAKEGRKELDSGEFVDTGHWYNFILLQANLLPLLGSLILGSRIKYN
jgi:hypothetical protein